MRNAGKSQEMYVPVGDLKPNNSMVSSSFLLTCSILESSGEKG